jgi:hypothetical protein
MFGNCGDSLSGSWRRLINRNNKTKDSVLTRFKIKNKKKDVNECL